MKKLALYLAVGIAALVLVSAATPASVPPRAPSAATLHAWYVKLCRARSGVAAFALYYGVGPKHLYAMQRCVAQYVRMAHS